MGFMDVPKLDPPMGLYMFIVNILAPGFGWKQKGKES